VTIKQLLYHFIIGTRVVILDAPLLIESGLFRICHRVVVVSVAKETQIKRLIARNEFSESDSIKRIESQMSLEQKLRYATDIVENNGPINGLRNRVNDLALKFDSAWTLFNRWTLSVLLVLPIVTYFAYSHFWR